jgi:hypothetical protein
MKRKLKVQTTYQPHLRETDSGRLSNEELVAMLRHYEQRMRQADRAGNKEAMREFERQVVRYTNLLAGRARRGVIVI